MEVKRFTGVDRERSRKEVILIVVGGSFVGLAMTLFVKRVLSMYRKSGPLFTALYLKQCSVALQRYYAGNRVDKEMLPIYMSLTRSGLLLRVTKS